MLRLIRTGVILAGIAAVFSSTTSVASAQDCGSQGCGPRTCKKCGCPATGCGHFGLVIYPRCEYRYIKQFCSPTIAPGSCFGYFRTNWTPWQEACPNWCDHDESMPIYSNSPMLVPAPGMQHGMQSVPPTPVPVPTPTPPVNPMPSGR